MVAPVARAALPVDEPRTRVAEAVVLVPGGQDEAHPAIRWRPSGGARRSDRPLLMGAASVESEVQIPALVEIPPLELSEPLADAVDPQKGSE